MKLRFPSRGQLGREERLGGIDEGGRREDGVSYIIARQISFLTHFAQNFARGAG
jgi:hypothetical protein